MQISQLPPRAQQLLAQMQGQTDDLMTTDQLAGAKSEGIRPMQAQQLLTLARLNVGDAIWAEVLKSEGGDVRLKLPGGEVFSAQQTAADNREQITDNRYGKTQQPQSTQQPQAQMSTALQPQAQTARPLVASAQVQLPIAELAPQTSGQAQMQPQSQAQSPQQAPIAGQSPLAQTQTPTAQMPQAPQLPQVQLPTAGLPQSNLPQVRELPVGQTLMFTVTDKSTPARPMFRNQPAPTPRLTVTLTDPKILTDPKAADVPKLLRAFGAPLPAPGDPIPTKEQIQIGERNVNVVRAMVAGGLPVSRDNFQAITAGLGRNPALTPEQAVFMTRENIPINPPNVQHFQQFLEHKGLVGEQLQAILTLLEDVPADNRLQITDNRYGKEVAAPQAKAENLPVREQNAPQVAARLEQAITALFRRVDPHNAHTLPRELNAAALTRELNAAVELLYERLERTPDSPARAELHQAVRELEGGTRFIQQVSNFTPVVTIPLQWGNERTTAELYVFNDSENAKKRIDPQNATIFLSLMTANVGRVETFIKVLGKNVECDFKLELPETALLVSGHMLELSNLLEEQGYALARTSVAEKTEASDIMDVSRIREDNKTRYFFDRKV